jgi:hypothetical protein
MHHNCQFWCEKWCPPSSYGLWATGTTISQRPEGVNEFLKKNSFFSLALSQNPRKPRKIKRMAKSEKMVVRRFFTIPH